MLGTLIMPGRDPLAIFTTFARRYGDVVAFRLGGERVFLVNHPDYVRQVLVTDNAKFAKGRALERARRLLGDGLLTSERASHQRKRRLVQPAFHRAQVAGYARTMVERAERMSARWQDGVALDVSTEMARLTLSIAASTLFDADIDSDADDVGAALTDVLQSFWLQLLPFSDVVYALPIAAIRKSKAARVRLDALIYRMVQQRRSASAQRRQGVVPDSARSDVLSMLIDAHEDESALSDQEIRDEVMTLLLAGHETTANALMWTWYLLSQSPDARARLQREVDGVLGGRPPEVSDAAALPFTTAVVTEAMRLYPPAWTIGRRALEPVEIGGYAVPAGALVFMSQWTLHRDARFFGEPERFLPERWTAEFKAALPKHAYFPFGGGTRQCIGESFAWMELVLVVAAIAARWELELVPGHPVVPQPLLTLRAKHGMRMIARARHNSDRV
jgi:cytochrome P450